MAGAVEAKSVRVIGRRDDGALLVRLNGSECGVLISEVGMVVLGVGAVLARGNWRGVDEAVPAERVKEVLTLLAGRGDKPCAAGEGGAGPS